MEPACSRHRVSRVIIDMKFAGTKRMRPVRAKARVLSTEFFFGVRRVWPHRGQQAFWPGSGDNFSRSRSQSGQARRLEIYACVELILSFTDKLESL